MATITKTFSINATIKSDLVDVSAGDRAGKANRRHKKHRRKNRDHDGGGDGDNEHQGLVLPKSEEELAPQKKSKKRNKTLVKVREIQPGVTVPASEDCDVSLVSKNELPSRGLNKDNKFVEHLTAIASMGDIIDNMMKKIKKGAMTNKNHKKIVTSLTRIKSECTKLETLF